MHRIFPIKYQKWIHLIHLVAEAFSHSPNTKLGVNKSNQCQSWHDPERIDLTQSRAWTHGIPHPILLRCITPIFRAYTNASNLSIVVMHLGTSSFLLLIPVVVDIPTISYYEGLVGNWTTIAVFYRRVFTPRPT